MITPPKRRLMQGYDSKMLGDGPDPMAPPKRMAPTSGAATTMPSPVPPMGFPDQPQDPMAAINPLNADMYMGIQKRKLQGLV